MHKNHIVSLSGGKDSTAMLLMMLEKGMKIDRIICIDTTKEYPGMYRHLNQLQAYLINNYPSCPKIETVSIDFDYWFKEHTKTKGINKGSKGYGWPGFGNRWCTALKRQSFKKITKSLKDVVEYHGIAADEVKRTNNNKGREIRYPLVDFNITEKQALQYCFDKGFNWKNNEADVKGLYELMDRVSCYMCPLQKLKDLKYKYAHCKDTLWKEMKDLDSSTNYDFRGDYTLDQLEDKFECEIVGGKWSKKNGKCVYDRDIFTI